MDKIKTGSLYDVAEVFRDLFLLKLTKDLMTLLRFFWSENSRRPKKSTKKLY
jgi:RNA polymerase-interacting CarD/CdnL/TRCF family regulator